MSLFNETEKPIGLAADHAGYPAKQYIKNVFEQRGVPYHDFGTYTEQSTDYPDYAHQLAEAVESGECYMGVAICGTGNGINMTLNKHQGIRSALCWDVEIAKMARAHNDANVIALPGRYLSEVEIYDILVAFMNTPFEGGRHQRRIDKIPCAKK